MTNAESFSLDGLIISSTLSFPFKSVSKHYREDPLLFIPPPIVPIDRTVEETFLMSSKEAYNLATQSVRSVSIETWEYLCTRNAHLYGNTGRPNKRPWINATNNTLGNGFVRALFKDIYFRPGGVSNIESKGAAILGLTKMYDHVTHVDVDPWVIFGLARVFPNVHFVLVQDLKSGTLFSLPESKQFDNVERVGHLLDFKQQSAPIERIGGRQNVLYQSYFESKRGEYNE